MKKKLPIFLTLILCISLFSAINIRAINDYGPPPGYDDHCFVREDIPESMYDCTPSSSYWCANRDAYCADELSYFMDSGDYVGARSGGRCGCFDCDGLRWHNNGGACATQDCDIYDSTCVNYHDVSMTCSNGRCLSASCNSYTYTSSYCANQDCDPYDTECTDYHDVGRYCSGGSCAGASCTSYTYRPVYTACSIGACNGAGICIDVDTAESYCSALYGGEAWGDIDNNPSTLADNCCGDDASDVGAIYSGYICVYDGVWKWDLQSEILSAYWSDMYNEQNQLENADNLDKVKTITISQYIIEGEQITIEIYEYDTALGWGILDWLVPDNLVETITQTVDLDGKGVVEWAVPDVSETTYYYVYSYYGGETSRPSEYLEISPDEDNSPPTALIDAFPSSIFGVSENIDFVQSSYDIDGTIESYAWDFDGGNPAISTSAGPVTVSYASAGPKYITLTVTDEKGASSEGDIGILIDDASNQAPLIVLSSPESGQTYSETVLCDASLTIDDNTAFDDLIFTWYFDNVEDPDHANVRGGDGGATFIKSFDTAGSHSIAVMVDDGE